MVSIHALLAECDTPAVKLLMHFAGFNPRTPCGVRPVPHHCLPDWMRFNPRTPCGVRHAMLSCAGPCRRFQSTHSLRSATGYCWTRRQGLSVSIHALLAECDEICNDYKNQQYGFNPRTPCGVRLSDWFSPCPANQFQSTHSLRSATCFSGIRKTCRKVSIHALLAECDSLRMKQLVDVLAFQSTHSLRSATCWLYRTVRPAVVSIHALLAECDEAFQSACNCWKGFNPRTPCGVRLRHCGRETWIKRFQSTHSLRSATAGRAETSFKQGVSIHALLAECDSQDLGIDTDRLVSIHALLAECDRQTFSTWLPPTGFNPRTPCGVRLMSSRSSYLVNSFQSTHSLRSATAPDLIHGYSTEQIILCANLPKKTVIARLLFLSIYLSIFYSQCITPIADLPGNSCELEVGAQAMFNSL